MTLNSVPKQRLEVKLIIDDVTVWELIGVKRTYEVGNFPFRVLGIRGEQNLATKSDYASFPALYDKFIELSVKLNLLNKMSNYNCLGCGNSGISYDNKIAGNHGNYDGKDDYASGMPDLKMRDYSKMRRDY